MAQNRLVQLEMTRRSAWGTAAEVLGPDFVDLDQDMRLVGHSRLQIQEQMTRLAPEYRTMLAVYADGINDAVELIETGTRNASLRVRPCGFPPAAVDARPIFPPQYLSKWLCCQCVMRRVTY